MTFIDLIQTAQQFLIVACLISSGYTMISASRFNRKAYERLGRAVTGGSVIYCALWMIVFYFS